MYFSRFTITVDSALFGLIGPARFYRIKRRMGLSELSYILLVVFVLFLVFLSE